MALARSPNIQPAWAKVRNAAHYAGMSERTLRTWLRDGLPHSRLPSGTVLIRLEDLDIWLAGFAASKSRIDQIVDEVLG